MDTVSEHSQVYATFFSDPADGCLMERWGQDTFMRSNDYPPCGVHLAALTRGDRQGTRPFAQGHPAKSGSRELDQTLQSQN